MMANISDKGDGWNHNHGTALGQSGSSLPLLPSIDNNYSSSGDIRNSHSKGSSTSKIARELGKYEMREKFNLPPQTINYNEAAISPYVHNFSTPGILSKRKVAQDVRVTVSKSPSYPLFDYTHATQAFPDQFYNEDNTNFT
jgi:hypothetical protein